VIQVRDLRKSYGSLAAVDGVSFELRQGETFGLLGPNGAGKTTTIHLMVGVLTPDAGSVTVDGGAAPTHPDARRRLGFAPQAQALYGDLTGEENIAFFARLYGLGGERLRERVRGALELAGLTERRRDQVKKYSGGMQRRLNLACAVVHDPPVLFLDEPTVGVDPQSRTFIFENLETLRARGKAILYTTHYLEEVERLCRRVVIVDQGRVVADDRVEALRRGPGGEPRTLESAFLSLTGRSLRDP
jgi:ABC-2 type transport system ATP-binding protein